MREAAYLRTLGTGPLQISSRRSPTKVQARSHDSRKDRLGDEIRSAGISLSTPLYLACCVIFSFAVFVAALMVGPVFAVFSGLVLMYELVSTFPKERAARRRQRIGEHIPLCLELLGNRLADGVTLDVALVSVVHAVPQGPLADELKLTIQAMQEGEQVADELQELANRIRGGEIRAFVMALLIFGSGELQSGSALVEYSRFMQSRSGSIAEMTKHVRLIRAVFMAALVLVLLISMGLTSLVPRDVMGHTKESLSMLHELGTMLLLVGALAVDRMTGVNWWEDIHGG